MDVAAEIKRSTTPWRRLLAIAITHQDEVLADRALIALRARMESMKDREKEALKDCLSSWCEEVADWA